MEGRRLRPELLDAWPANWQAWQSRFLQWLEGEKWNADQILSWMSQSNLPSEDPKAAPHLWPLRAIPPGNRQHELRGRLAGRVAKVLDSRPDQQRGETADTALYNLLYLCAGLDQPDEVAEALDRLLTRSHAAERTHEGTPMAAALRAALIWNQKDRRWLGLWEKMVEGKPDARVPGTPDDGLDGILRVRPSATAAGKPAVHEIGRAIDRLAERLERDVPDEGKRNAEFRRLLARVARTRPSLDQMDISSMKVAKRWPSWTGQMVSDPPFCEKLFHFVTTYFENVSREEALWALSEAWLCQTANSFTGEKVLREMACVELRPLGKREREDVPHVALLVA